MSRKPATAEDMKIGAIVYKGNGKVAYRVAAYVEDLYQGRGGWNVVKVTSKATKGRYYEPVRVFTIES